MKLKVDKLKKWENELNVCIRCGYCYEHCHLFKLTGWEVDTPRGKLLLIYGLVTGEIVPSEYIAEKIFECFYCKNCGKSCSANVAVTDIFTEAREVLKEAGFDVDGTTVKVDKDMCSGCGICVSVCKAEATKVEKEEGKRKAVVDKVKCQSCGVCVAACPTGARKPKEGYQISPKELRAKVAGYLVGAR